MYHAYLLHAFHEVGRVEHSLGDCDSSTIERLRDGQVKLFAARHEHYAVLIQMKTGTVSRHTFLNVLELHRIGPAQNPNYRHCRTNMQTVQHLLLHCPQLSEMRCQLLLSQPNIYNTLCTSSTQLRNTALFARRAMSC
jgi:hypothetical protein